MFQLVCAEEIATRELLKRTAPLQSRLSVRAAFFTGYYRNASLCAPRIVRANEIVSLADDACVASDDSGICPALLAQILPKKVSPDEYTC
jgi:hypothetical protein